MQVAKERKTDRRTIYTVGVLKDALLELEREKPYAKISVKQVCERADVSRTTFYSHFDSLDDLLNAVLDDALLFSQEASGSALDLIEIIRSGHDELIRENEAVLPACQRIADSARYHDLFMDRSLSEYIIMRIMRHEMGRVVPAIVEKTGLDVKTADMLFCFMLHGSFYVNRSLDWEKNEEWFRFQKTVSVFLDAGLKALSKQPRL